jgi:squamous cell carcinoma antigen recognized by T-cells 3
MSPSIGPDGIARSPSVMSTTPSIVDQNLGDRHARTIALMNIPDTVNDSRLRAIAERYGGLVKVVLRPDHQGAILEYTDISNTGKASLALDGYEIIPGRKLRVGTLPEMLKQKAEVRKDKIQVGQAKKAIPPSILASLQPSGPIRRPFQQVGKRGGLGQRRGLGFTASNIKGGENSQNLPSEGGKSNDDFRDMLTKK